MTSINRALPYAVQHHPRFVAELKSLVRFPSISGQAARAGDMAACAATRLHLEQIIKLAEFRRGG